MSLWLTFIEVLFAKYSTWKDNTHVDLTTATYPANPRAMLSNIATGAHPSVHGIVGDSWVHPNGEKVSAHAASEGVSLAANMADILTQEWAGASLTVSASSSGSMASAFAVNQQFTSDNAFALSMDNGAFGPIYDQSASPLSLNKEALQAIFNDASFSAFLGAKITNNDNKLTITVRSSTATFDLNSKVWALRSLYWVLIFYLYRLILHSLRSSALYITSLISSRSIPNSLLWLLIPFLISIPSFSLVWRWVILCIDDINLSQEIRAQYGEQSDAFVAALNLVDVTIQQAVTKFDNLYGGRAVSAVACLNTNTVVSDELKGRIYDTVRNYYNNEEDFSLHFPSLYIKGNAGQACSQLKSALGGSAEVHCFASSYNWMDGLLASSSDDGNTTNPIPINTANVSTFWILFFLTLGIFSAVIVGVISLVAAGEDAAKDSLLFRSAGRAHAH